MVYNVITELTGLFKFLKRYGGVLEEIVQLIGFSTLIPGLINPIFNKPKRKLQPRRRVYPYQEEKFSFSFKDPLTIKTRRTYQWNEPLNVITPVHMKSQTPLDVLTDVKCSEVSSLTVITNLDTVVLEKIIIFSEMIYKSIEKIRISTFLKSSILEALKISTGLKNRLKDKLKIKSSVKSNKIRDRLENQSVYMDDVGQIEEIELIQILGDIDALR